MSSEIARLDDPGTRPALVSEGTREQVLADLHARLRSLDDHCLRSLQEGLGALVDGDNTLAADAVTEPIVIVSDDPFLRAIGDTFNAMLARSQAAVAAYEELRAQLAHALGEQSCLEELAIKLKSLDAHCLTDLDVGLQAVVDGDLTHSARPVTMPLKAAPDARLGELGETFNAMLARSRTALYSYNTMREDLRVTLGDQSCLDDLRQRLTSLYRHCLRDLDEGLEAVASGTDLTREVMAVTPPITAEDERDLGELAEVFNRMLARAQSSLAHYDELRRRERLV